MERFIDIKGAQNLRDIGGYSGKDGRQLKWRMLFRSGLLTRIADTEDAKMAALQLKTICDFRTTTEQNNLPDRWFELAALQRYSFPVGEGRIDQLDWIEKANKGKGKDSYLYHANRSYVTTNAAQYKDFFQLLLEEKNYPILYHCTAGKDRTGFATALLLSALGVDKKTIFADYLLTNFYLEHKGGWAMLQKAADRFGFDLEQVKPILIADEVYLQGAYDAMEEHYGHIDHFLQEVIGLDAEKIAKLQDLLLES